MGKNHVRGSKGDLRRGLIYASKQLQEMSAVLAVLLDREGGSIFITKNELDALNINRTIKVNPDENGDFTIVVIDESKLSAEDIGIG